MFKTKKRCQSLFLGVVAIVMAVLLGPTACDQTTNQTTNSNNGEEIIIPDPTDPFAINPDWPQTKVNQRANTLLVGMSSNCDTVKNAYGYWADRLREKPGWSVSFEEIQVNYAENIKSAEVRLAGAYRGRNASQVMTGASAQIDSMVEYTKSFIGDTARYKQGITDPYKVNDSKNLFDMRVRALRVAHYLNNRNHASPAEEKQANNRIALDLRLQAVQVFGGGEIPTDDLNVTISMLETGLRNTPAIQGYAGPALDIIEQIAQHAKLEGWFDDLLALGYNPDLTSDRKLRN